jgi:hypothetical protein
MVNLFIWYRFDELNKDFSIWQETQQASEADLQNFQVFLPKVVHKKIKAYCIQEDLNLKDFSTEAIIEKAKNLGVI